MSPLALRPDNPMNRALVAILVCEVIAFALAIPGLVLVEHVPLATALVVGLVPVVLALLGSATLRRTWGFALGWLAQLTAVAVGMWTPWMYVLGGIFLLTWATAFALGRKIEAKPAR